MQLCSVTLLSQCLFVLLLFCCCANFCLKQRRGSGVSAVMRSNADSYAFLL